MNQGLPGFRSSGAIVQYRIVRLAGTDLVAQASAATDTLLSVAKVGTAATVGGVNNQHIDLADIGEVIFCEAGAAIAVGARITADALGRGVPAAPAVGVNNSVIGIALQPVAAAGSVFRLLITPQVLQG